jgi:hypothetical protein
LQALPRYEAHLSRRAISALHELEALQRARVGLPAQLARIDINGAMPEPETLVDISQPAGEDLETRTI